MIFHWLFILFEMQHSLNPTTMESSEPSFQRVCQMVCLCFLLVSVFSSDSSHSLYRGVKESMAESYGDCHVAER